MATPTGDRTNGPVTARLTSLTVGQPIVYGGDRVTFVGEELAAAFRSGDEIVVDPSSGAILHVPADIRTSVSDTVARATGAFAGLARCSDDQVTRFFDEFADRLADDATFAPVAEANAADVVRARDRNRSTTRLELSPRMRADMVAGLRGWASWTVDRDAVDRRVDHDGWTVEARRAPLGVVGFVFEGRPNVFADTAGVVRTGNTVVFRIG
ncbi:MAG: glutamate-5-semialdehyde dehydrogenase, partial [Acidimicrobiia bacterium]